MPWQRRMTAPRQILAGVSYLVTRRCSERRFFLRPSKETNAIFGYLLAVVAAKYGVLVHAFCVLSNHVHLVLTDVQGRLPEFNRDLDALVARAVNCSLGRWEAFWDRDSYSAVRLETKESVLEKLVYVLANPVAAGLVRRASEWPGLWSDEKLLRGEARRFERPEGFFRPNGPMPQSAELVLTPPPGFEGDPSFVDGLLDLLRREEDRIRAERGEKGRSFVGAARVRAQMPTARPKGIEPRRNLKPNVACRNKWKRIEALLQLKSFREAYREALASWKKGVRDALFPPGTWLMRVQHRVCCAATG